MSGLEIQNFPFEDSKPWKNQNVYKKLKIEKLFWNLFTLLYYKVTFLCDDLKNSCFRNDKEFDENAVLPIFRHLLVFFSAPVKN